MGGIPGDVPGGAGRGPGQLGADGAAVGVPQESPRSEETDACENQWGEDQACCDGENIKSPRKVCKLTRLEGWLRHADDCPDRPLAAATRPIMVRLTRPCNGRGPSGTSPRAYSSFLF